MRASARILAIVIFATVNAFAIPALGQDSEYYAIKKIAGKLKQPTGIALSPDGRLFITERAGRILILKNGEVLRRPFLDLSEKVDATPSFEQGLLGLAFDPLYAANGFFYIAYSDAEYTVHLERYQASAYPDVALPGSVQLLLSIRQKSPLHKGGHLRFGPDGYLYMSVGDGGFSDQPDSSGQNWDDLLGKILRLDVSGALPYAIPADNPFVGVEGYRPEIWLLGLRNPWRFSFAPGSRALFIADVGWANIEEINYLPADDKGGGNFGWPMFEGELPVEREDSSAPMAREEAGELIFPAYSYPHLKPLGYDGSFPIGCAIIGGHIYRGDALPELKGLYLYSDYCNGELWTLWQDEEGWHSRKLIATGLNVTALDEDARGEIYISSIEGQVHKLIHAPDNDNDADTVPNADDNCPLIANPDQADHWGAVGVGDACDQDYYFSKVGGTEVKMFQQHHGAFHVYACNAGGCGFVANLEPSALLAADGMQERNEQFGWMIEATFAGDSDGQTVFDVSIFDSAGAYYVDDLQLLIAEASLSWRYAS